MTIAESRHQQKINLCTQYHNAFALGHVCLCLVVGNTNAPQSVLLWVAGSGTGCRGTRLMWFRGSGERVVSIIRQSRLNEDWGDECRFDAPRTGWTMRLLLSFGHPGVSR